MSVLNPSPDIVLRGHRESVNCLKFLPSNLLASGLENFINSFIIFIVFLNSFSSFECYFIY